MSPDRSAHARLAEELERRVAETRRSLPPRRDPPSPVEIERLRARGADAARRLRKLLTYWLVSHPFCFGIFLPDLVVSGGKNDLWTDSVAFAVGMGAVAVVALFSSLAALASAGIAVWYWRSLPWRWRVAAAIPWAAMAAEIAVLFILETYVI